MIFTAKILLAGCALAAIPLIIHLLNRSRHRKVQWGAMHLLGQVVRTNRRRLQIQQLILLAIRCAFPAVLAFALAGPVLTDSQILPGDAPGRTVILVDNSYSLSAADPESPAGTAFDSASRAVNEILELQAEGTEIALVSIGSRPTVVEPPTLDRRQIRRQFETITHPDSDPPNLTAAFQLADELLESSQRPRKTIILVSDFQKTDWQEIPKLKDKHTSIAFYKVGDSREGNIAVENLQLPPLALSVGQEIEVTATVRNFGSAIDETPVFLRINGDRVAAAQIDLPAGGSTEVSFQQQFNDPGSHLVQIEVDVVDPLPFDNRQAAAIAIPAQLPVLVIDPSAHVEPNFLKASLAPFELDGIGIEDLIRTTFVTPDEFESVQLYGNRAVILTNVKELTETQLLTIDEFIRDGGGLVIFAGSDANPRWYNEQLFPLLAPDVTWQRILPEPETPARILRERSSHPVFEIFNETDNGDPSTATIKSWLDVGLGRKTQVLSRLSDSPFLVESIHHPGRVLVAAVDVKNQWSDMANHPFFVPLMQRLAVYAATNTVPPRNLGLGQPLVALLPPKTAGEVLGLTDAAGHTHNVTAETEGGVAKAVFPNAQRPGPWTLANPHGSGPIHFAVQSDRAESDLKLLTKAELGTIANELGATLVQSQAELSSFEKTTRFGSEIWRPFLLLALILLFADVYLAQRFTKIVSKP